MTILSRVIGADSQEGGAGLISRASVSNLGAQVGALAAVSAASLMVARVGGPAVVGEYALLRVLPWLFGVVLSCGLPTASAFFLAADQGRDRNLRPTLGLLTIAGAALGSLAWLACAMPFHAIFFKQMPVGLIAVMSVVVITQLCTVTAKGCCQGGGDMAGANLVIVAEELWFVFCYPAVLLTRGDRGVASVVLALILSGTLSTLTGLLRLVKRGFFADWGVPSPALAKRVAAFGGRGQLGNMLWLTNLRFDFVLLGALAGPAVLGIYAVASKFAELMRLAPTAINYVLYPRFARIGTTKATAEARRMLPRATALTLVMTPFVAVISLFALPILYGSAFRGAVAPAEIIIIGLSIEGAAAVSSAFLLGSGRPGLNSVGMGVGATITVTLDVILIPRYGALGGAVTSAVTYAATTVTLSYIAHRVARTARPLVAGPPRYQHVDAGLDDAAPTALRPDTLLRRAVDLVTACVGLLVASPLLLATAVAVRATSRGPALYKQVRVGKSGRPFTILKFRSMVCNADSSGPLVTDRADPRVTKVGSLLRASKLDELPQLFNVMRGDMTLIGPRPEVPRFLPWYNAEELATLSVRPGLTGAGQTFYADGQTSGDEPADDPEARYVGFQLHPKLAVDLDYLHRRNLRFDLAILMRTMALICHVSRPAPETPLPSAPATDQPHRQRPPSTGHSLKSSDEAGGGASGVPARTQPATGWARENGNRAPSRTTIAQRVLGALTSLALDPGQGPARYGRYSLVTSSGHPRDFVGAADPTILSTSITLCPTRSAGATRIMAVDTAETATASAPAHSDAPGEETRSDGGRTSLRGFGTAAAVSAILLGAFITWMAIHPGTLTSTRDLDDVVKIIAALVAAASCYLLGRHASPQPRLAWMWIGASATTWAIGEAILTWYDLARKGAVPFPSAADAGFLAALPLAAIGVLLFPSAPRFGVSRARVLLDGAIVAGSLLIVSWTTALGTVYSSGSGSVFSQAVGLAYPIGDVIVATVAIGTLAQSRGRQRVPLALVVTGLLCLTVTDSALAYLTTHIAGFRYGTLVDSGRVAGFLLIALALAWPLEHTIAAGDDTESPSAWQVALPYFFLAIAIAAAVVKRAQSGPLDRFVVIAGLCVITAVLARQVVTLVENLRLTGQMRSAVTTLRANQVELVHYALHDPLTDLPNRVLFGDRIEHALARRASPTRRVAVLLCDLDSFKDVNDTLGHSSGDEVLISAADRLSSCVRPGDTVARIGGDEFAILIDDASGVDEVASVAARVCSAMRSPFTLAGRDFIVHASVGIAMGNQRDARSDELLRDADVALYAAKDAGGDDYMFFEPRLGKAYVDRLGLQAELAAALDNGQLFVEYQPVVELASGRTVGVEALLRWRHPRRGVLEPVDFLAVAESSGIVVQIGAWVLEEVLAQLRKWKDRIPAAGRLWTAVNVSARQLASGDLVGAVSKAIGSSGIEPESLHIELTESAVIDQVDWSLLVLGDLKALGVTLEIDDFGTGYSSLAYLKQLPIDGVKIDRVFVEGLGADGRDAVIVEAVVSLAHALQLKVAAEGVETVRQVEWLRTLGCDYGQGYYWSTPLPPAELEQWLGDNLGAGRASENSAS